MNKSSVLFHSLFFFLGLVIYGKSFSEPLNLSILKNELIQYHDSGEYMKDIKIISQQAQHYITQQARQNHGKKIALILDIDETCLSNYDNLIDRDFINDYKRIHRDTFKVNATPIPATLRLFNIAKKEHIHVFFISGRYEFEREATIKNLHSAGFKGWDGLLLESNNHYGKKGTIEDFKIAARKSLTKKGYTIIANVGDQPTDLSGGYAQKTFKLPNPFYYSPSHYTANKKAA